MKCNIFYDEQCCTSCFKSEGTKILNTHRMTVCLCMVNLKMLLFHRPGLCFFSHENTFFCPGYDDRPCMNETKFRICLKLKKYV